MEENIVDLLKSANNRELKIIYLFIRELLNKRMD